MIYLCALFIPRAWPGLMCTVYEGNYKTLLHTKYISCGPHGFREEEIF